VFHPPTSIIKMLINSDEISLGPDNLYHCYGLSKGGQALSRQIMPVDGLLGPRMGSQFQTAPLTSIPANLANREHTEAPSDPARVGAIGKESFNLHLRVLRNSF
jgi:hypothetical protein